MSVYKSMYRMVFTLIIVPFILFGLLVTHIYSVQTEHVITESLQVVANSQVTEMANFCEQQKALLVFTGNMEMSRAAMQGKLDRIMLQYLDNILLSQVQTQNSYMNTLVIIDKDSRIVACSKEHRAFAEHGVNEIIADMGDKPFYISDVLTDEQGQRMLVAITRIEDNDELLGYVLAEISLDFYSNIREQAQLWNEATFYLLDGKRQIISAGTSDENRETFVTAPGDRENYLRKYNEINFEETPYGSFQYKLGGRNYMTYYSGVEYTNWRVMLTVCMDHFEAKRPVITLLALFLVLLCVMLSVWLSRFASVRIIQPIKNISDTLKAIRQKQDYRLRISIGRTDELGTLSGEINKLIAFIETEDYYKAQQQRLLKEKSEQDALTKVLNKERITQCLQEAIDRHHGKGTKVAVLFVDIDDFKSFNTHYGHSVGDQVLLFLTSILARVTGGTVGRIGGDEFLVIIEAPETIRELEHCLNQIEEISGSQFVVRGSGTHLPVSCSIGAVRIHFTDSSAHPPVLEQLLNIADEAMYQAKNKGKRGFVITDYDDSSTTAPS